MFKELEDHLDAILSTYSEGSFYDQLIAAKKKYFELTGPTHEEDDDYEARMRCFNNWFIMHYELEEGLTALELYLESGKVSESFSEVLNTFIYSIFEFTGKSLSGKLVVKNLLNGEKIIFTKNSSLMPVFKGELFIGRLLKIESDIYLMNGINLIPSEVKSILKKQIKKRKKKEAPKSETEFLLEIENLNTKYKRFGHVEASKIFIFEK